MRYVGVDLTAAFGPRPRSVDIAILEGSKLELRKWTWPEPKIVREAAQGLASSFCEAIDWQPTETIVAIDGPQALAEAGTVRQAELNLATPGRTPSTMPSDRAPFGTYIQSSVLLFRSLLSGDLGFRLAGLGGLPQVEANLFEVFPGAEWRVLFAGRVPKKTSKEGRKLRGQLWSFLGLSGAPSLPTADENDAIVAAVLAKWAREAGHPTVLLGREPRGHPLREGLILHSDAALVSPAAGLTTQIEGECEKDWTSDEDSIEFTDNGLLQGSEPGNRWLVSGCDYTLVTLPPLPFAKFELRHSSKTSGGRGWKCVPTVRKLLAGELGLEIPDHLSKTDRRAIRVCPLFCTKSLESRLPKN